MLMGFVRPLTAFHEGLSRPYIKKTRSSGTDWDIAKLSSDEGFAKRAERALEPLASSAFADPEPPSDLAV
jgi:hypothetical protein